MPRTSIAHLQTYLSTGALRLHLVGANYTRVGMVKDPVSGLYLRGVSMEPERQNRATYNTDLNIWSAKTGVTTPATPIVCPDGLTRTTVVLHEDGGLSSHFAYNGITAYVLGTTYALSVYAHVLAANRYPIVGISNNCPIATFDPSSGTVYATGTEVTIVSATVSQLDSYWYRFSMIWVKTVGNRSGALVLGMADDLALHASHVDTFQGLDQDTIAYCFHQDEANSTYSSSPIITNAAAVTRTADTSTIYVLGNEMLEKRGCLCIPVLMTERTPAADTAMFSIYKSGAAATDHITGWIEQTTGYFKVTSAASGKSAGSLSVAKNIADGNVHHLCIAWRDGTIVAWVDTATSAADLDAGVAPDLNRWDYKACGGWVGGPQVTFPDVIPGTPPRYVQPVWSQS